MEIQHYLVKKSNAILGNQWSINEIYFNATTQLFLLWNVSTKVILGSCLLENGEVMKESIRTEFHQILLQEYDIRNDIKITFIEDLTTEEMANKMIELILFALIQKDSKSLRNWRQTVPKSIKLLSNTKKVKNAEFQSLLLNSDYFQENKSKAIATAILEYNERRLALHPLPVEIERSTLTISQDEDLSMEQIKQKLVTIVESEIATDQKITEIAYFMIASQNENTSVMKRGFTGLAIQNEELLQQNVELKEQLQSMQDQLQSVSKILEEKLEQERLLEEKRQRRKNQKRLVKREPITKEIYEWMISKANSLDYSNSFRGARLRLALALLLVTGIRISELLPLKISQVKTLFEKSWIAIDRTKKGPASHKAFLTQEGKHILKDRWKDLESVSYFKTNDSYIFTGEDSEKPLDRDAFNRIINDFIKDCSDQFEGKPRLRSHSFRIGFITQLWKDTNDIEFVRQAIGHSKLDTTSQYVKNLSEQERRERMQQIENKTTKN